MLGWKNLYWAHFSVKCEEPQMVFGDLGKWKSTLFAVLCVLTIVNNATITLVCEYLFETLLSIFLWIYAQIYIWIYISRYWLVLLLDHRVILFLVSWRIAGFSIVVVPFYIPTISAWGSIFSTSPSTHLIFFNSNFDGYELIFHWSFNLNFCH